MLLIVNFNNFITAANEQNKDLQLQVESKSSLLKDLSQQNSDFEAQIETIKLKLKEQTNEKEDIEKRICILQSDREKDKSKFEVELKELHNSKEMLLKLERKQSR